MVIREQINSSRYTVDHGVFQNNYITVSYHFNQIFHNMKAKVKLFPPLSSMFNTTQMAMHNFKISLFKQITVTVPTSLNNVFPVRQYKNSALDSTLVLARFGSDKLIFYLSSFRRLDCKLLIIK